MIVMSKFISMALIVYGCLLILRPDILKKIFDYMKEDNRIYVSGGIKVAVGLIFVKASFYCRIPWIVLFFGSLSILGGVTSLLIKKQAILQVVEGLLAKSPRYVYLIGAITLVLGALLTLAV